MNKIKYKGRIVRIDNGGYFIIYKNSKKYINKEINNINKKKTQFRITVKLEIKPKLKIPFYLNKSNLNKLVKWWRKRLIGWDYIKIYNLKVISNIKNKKINIIYEVNSNISKDKIRLNNKMIANPDDDGNYPIYIKNNNIISINREDEHLGNDTLVIGKLIKMKKFIKNNFGTESIRILKPETIKKTQFENLPDDLIYKIDTDLQDSYAKHIQKMFRSRKEIIKLEIVPETFLVNLNNKSNLDKLVNWWKKRLVDWDYIPTNNIKIYPNYINKTIIIIYDVPKNISNNIINRNNLMISDPDHNGNYPIYIKNSNIVSINRDDEDAGTDILVFGRLLDSKILKIIA